MTEEFKFRTVVGNENVVVIQRQPGAGTSARIRRKINIMEPQLEVHCFSAHEYEKLQYAADSLKERYTTEQPHARRYLKIMKTLTKKI